MKRALMSLGAVAVSVSSAANAQLVVGNDQSAATNAMYYIDLGTGVATPILSGAAAQAWGMAYSGATNTLYWNNGGTLRQSAFSQSGLTPSAGVQLTFNGATSRSPASPGGTTASSGTAASRCPASTTSTR